MYPTFSIQHYKSKAEWTVKAQLSFFLFFTFVTRFQVTLNTQQNVSLYKPNKGHRVLKQITLFTSKLYIIDINQRTEGEETPKYNFYVIRYQNIRHCSTVQSSCTVGVIPNCGSISHYIHIRISEYQNLPNRVSV